MPDSLWDFFWFNRNLLGLISSIAAGIIQEIAQKKGVIAGIFTALHTFGGDLKRNIHIHLSVMCGGLDLHHKWQKLYFHHEKIKIMWRHRIITLFRSHYKQGDLVLPKQFKSNNSFELLMHNLYDIKWYVYLQKPTNDHKRNIRYLGRYLKRPPLSEARIEKYDGVNVTFQFLDHSTNTFERTTMSVFQFIASLIRQIPDRNFRAIRYYGILSNRLRGKLLPLVYKAIKQIPPKKLKKIGWRIMIWLNFGRDPLSCSKCNNVMQLNQVYYGLSPPRLLLAIRKIMTSITQIA